MFLIISKIIINIIISKIKFKSINRHLHSIKGVRIAAYPSAMQIL